MNTLRLLISNNLSPLQAMVMGFLFSTPGMRTSEVARATGVSLNYASNTLAWLHKNKFVCFDYKPVNNMRMQYPHYRLTNKGLTIAKQLHHEP